MIITLVNGKGGSGKTSVSILLAAALAEAGHEAAVLDTDPQQTATRWLTETNEVPLALDGRSYGALFIDTPPRLDSKRLAASIHRADLVVLVTSPSPADLYTSRDTVALLEQEDVKQRARVLFNQVQTGTILARELDEMAERIGLCTADRRTSMPCCWAGSLCPAKHAKKSSGWHWKLPHSAKEGSKHDE
jgi:chromosome partitioning protein